MMIEKVERYISDNRLLKKDLPIVVGFSGGADSMALLDILVKLGYKVVAAHCNFHLRGAESDEDEWFAEKWCAGNDIEFVAVDFDTVKHASDNKVSIEMAARNLRYGWFEKIRKQFGADVIAVAHHKDDSVETVLLNLSRGTGISGLRGILPKNGKIVRPLLCLNRNEIENYLKSAKIPYRTDSTNKQDIYRRNHIRLNILPALQKLNPSVGEAVFRTSQNLLEVEKVYRAAINTDIAAVMENNKIDIRKLQNRVSPQAVLYEILSPLGFSPAVIDDVAGSFDAESGKLFFSKAHRVIKDRNTFIIDNLSEYDDADKIFYIDKEQSKLSEPILLLISTENKIEKFSKSNLILYADADKLIFPLILRKWKQGDWFIPFGMKGKKKVSDFFTDQKFSIKEKEDVWLLFSGSDLVWIAGHRSDERFKVDAGTRKVLKINWTKR